MNAEPPHRPGDRSAPEEGYDIELAPVASRAVRVQINLHKSVLTDIDAAAQKRHITRSAFIALACVRELEHGEIEGTAREFRTKPGE